MLEKIKEYKEIIVIIVFFLGGFIWLENQYPKKTDLKSEIWSLDCLLKKYMTLTQLQIRGQNLKEEIQNLERKIKSTFQTSDDATKITLSPPLAHQLKKLQEAQSKNINDLSDIHKDMVSISEELQRNECRKVKP